MRTAEITRKTNETDIRLSLDLDGQGKSRVRTGVAFWTICSPCWPATGGWIWS